MQCVALRLLHYLHRREKRRRADEFGSYKYSRNGGAVQDGECSLIANETNSI